MGIVRNHLAFEELTTSLAEMIEKIVVRNLS